MVIHDLDVKWVPPWIGNLHKWSLISMLFQKWWYICCTLPFLLMPVLGVQCKLSKRYQICINRQFTMWVCDNPSQSVRDFVGYQEITGTYWYSRSAIESLIIVPFPGGKRIFLAFFRGAEHSQREKSWQVVQVTVGDGKANAPWWTRNWISLSGEGKKTWLP